LIWISTSLWFGAAHHRFSKERGRERVHKQGVATPCPKVKKWYAEKFILNKDLIVLLKQEFCRARGFPAIRGF
jgi:hypothetical protein